MSEPVNLAPPHATRLDMLGSATFACKTLAEAAEAASDRNLAQRASELGLLIAAEWSKMVEPK